VAELLAYPLQKVLKEENGDYMMDNELAEQILNQNLLAFKVDPSVAGVAASKENPEGKQ